MSKYKELAIRLHGDQMYGDKPYSYHLQQVADLVQGYGSIAEDLSWLHDVGEDTDISDEELHDSGCDDYLIQCIRFISDEEGATRKERKLKTNVKLSLLPIQYDNKHLFYEVLIVKTADRLANMMNSVVGSSYHEMYKKEYPEFRKAVYRKGLCDDLWDMLDKLYITW